MTPQEVIDNINEVYSNEGKPIAVGLKNSLYYGKSSSGLNIKIWIDNTTDKIQTAYPVY